MPLGLCHAEGTCVVLRQYRLALMSPLRLVDVHVCLQVALSTGNAISSVKWTALQVCG